MNRTQFILYSNTGLGRFIAILSILLASSIHISVGIVMIIAISSFYKAYSYETWNMYNTNDFMDGVDVIYWINLDRSNDRYVQMQTLLADSAFTGIPKHRIAAVDGNKDDVYDHLIMNTKMNTKLEYACLLSHLNAIRAFSESNESTALILEDDVTLEFKKYWRKSVREIIENAPADWEMIQLCYISSNNLKSEYTLNNYKKNSYGNIASMAAYLINANAARKLMLEMYDPKTGAYTLRNYHTHEADHYLFKCLRTYTYKYPYFIYPTENTSTLHPEDLSSHIRSKTRIEKMYYSLYNF
jgi:GR25 family glycosyltransferase involved in LPS biosynthesis